MKLSVRFSNAACERVAVALVLDTVSEYQESEQAELEAAVHRALRQIRTGAAFKGERVPPSPIPATKREANSRKPCRCRRCTKGHPGQ